jgi:predicted nucleotidyltransferase
MRTRALSTDLDGTAIHIVGVDDLIRMKQTAGRPSDIEDIQALTMVAQREGGTYPTKHGIEAGSSEQPVSDK